MSGLCGVFRFDGASVAARDIDLQLERMAHLGPDGSAAWVQGQVGLGHLMMQVTREDRLDAQPLHDGHLSLVCDARIDNRDDVAAELGIDPAALAGMADSDLILAAYKAWGEACADHLIGDFLIVVWNAEARTLTLIRDHMGQRHVFYNQGDGYFAFASQIKGLWALPYAPRTLIEDRIPQALLFEERNDPGATDYIGIRALVGGAVMTVGPDGAVSTRRYWEPHADPAHLGHDEAYYIETYRKVVGEAVECRLRRATAPGGLFMGGGFDSSAICALAGPVTTAQGRKFIAASSVMPEDYKGTIHHARPWVEMCRRHMPHLDVRYVTSEDADIFSFMEKGFLTGDNRHSPNRPNTELLFRAIRAGGARIVMDGHGGDYTVNPRVNNTLPRLLMRGELRRFVHELRAMRRHLGQSLPRTVLRNVIAPLVPPSWVNVLSRRRNGLALFGPTLPVSRQVIDGRPKGARSRFARERGEAHSAGMRRTLLSQQNFPAQAYSISGAAHGLEFTQPFHDKRVVEFGLAIPETLYVKDGLSRYLARKALKDLYPPQYQTRRPGNDDMGPDFLAMAKRIEPRVLAEIDRMEKAGRLQQYFDFPRMRAMLTRRTIDQHASGNEYDTRQAMLAFIAARYIEWFRGDNA